MDTNGTPPAPKGRSRGSFSPRPLMRALSRSIGWRLVITLNAALVLLLGITGWLVLQLHQKHLYSLLEETAIGIGETILSSTHSSMLKNDRESLTQILDNIGARENVIAVRLVDPRGEVRYSSRNAEVGQISDVAAPVCQGCHAGGEVRVPATLRDGLALYHVPKRGGMLGLGVPVLNSTECSNASCHAHPAEQRVIGVLDLELSTLPLEVAMSAARRQMAGFGVLTIVVFSVTISLLAWRVVSHPILALLAGTRRLAGGDLSYRISDVPSGEIGELASSFNEMTSRLQEAQIELEEWNQRLEAKVAVRTRELEQTRDQMVFAEKMASLGKLAAVVAHEINNPLAGILVYAKLVRRKLGKLLSGELHPPDKTYQDLDEKMSTIESEVARCGDIVRNLLLFSRHQPAARAPADINAIVERSLRLVQHLADLGGVTTRLQLEPELPEVTCESHQIQQSVLAMIMNALDAMPDGGTLTLGTQYERSRDEVEISVGDTGIGIPDEIRTKIFEPFFSTKSDGKGTGLGLSVMYGIIQRHEGRIDLDSRPGAGSIFRIHLPVSPKPALAGNAPSGPTPEDDAWPR